MGASSRLHGTPVKKSKPAVRRDAMNALPFTHAPDAGATDMGDLRRERTLTATRPRRQAASRRDKASARRANRGPCSGVTITMHAAILAARQVELPAAVPGMVSETSDEELLARIRAGRGEALAALIERYRRPLFGYLCRMLGDEAEADDVFQETFLRVVKNVERFETGRPVRPWLYAIAGNLVKNVYRSRAVRDHVPLDGPLDDDAPR